MNWVLGVIAAVLLGVVARDAWGWLPRLSRIIIWLETAPLSKDRRLLRREEWYAELAAEYDDRRLTGLLWTVKLCPISLWERATSASRPQPELPTPSAVDLVVRVADRVNVVDQVIVVEMKSSD